MNRRFQYFVVTASTCVVALLLFGAVYGNSAATTEDPYRHLAVYTEVLQHIKADYVEEPDMKNVTLGAINGLLESLDPYASYLSADQYKQYLKESDAGKADLGLIISKRFGYVGVISTVPGSAAAKAGLGTGDVIETINNISTRDMPLAYAEMLFRGEPGTSLEMGILRFRKPEPQKITLIRSVVTYPPVTAKLTADEVGVITVPSLYGDRTKEVAAKIEEMQKQGAKRLVLDLRNCATGTPEAGIHLANLFLDKGLITYLEGQKVTRQNFDAQPARAVTSLPLAVIINRGTADGSEVAAAALLDDKRAEVVGERSYGDAGVRKAVTMDDGSAVILSVAKYYSPGGKAIQDNGVTPSVQVAEADTSSDFDDDTVERPETKQGEDLLLKKAIEVVTKGKDVAAKTGAAGQAVGTGSEHPPILTPLNVPQPKKP